MRLWIAFFKIGWMNTITYRAESIVWFILDALPLIYFMSLWAFQASAGKISADQQLYLIFYYLAVLVISRLSASEFDTWATDIVKDGHISSHLLKPYNYKDYLYANEIVWRLSGILYLLPSIILLQVFFGDTLARLPINYSALFLVIPLLVLSFIQRLYLSYLIFIAAFWVDQVKFLSHVKWVLEGLLGGFWLPLSFMPVFVQTISKYSPFYNWYFFPIQILTKSVSVQELMLWYSIGIIWVVLLILLSKYLWRKAILKFTAVGN